MGKILAVCSSEKKGTEKVNIGKGRLIENYGLEHDAHAGNWHRQISLLSFQKIEDFRAKGAEVEFGAFGENLIVEGIDFRSLPVGTKFYVNDVILQLTQIGKECHNGCAIFQRMGDCIMPREGVFARVLHGGEVAVGDEMRYELPSTDAPLTAAVITLSDKGYKGEREDKSGPAICEILKENGYEIVETLLLPDEQVMLQKELVRLSDQRQVNLILTTGGTGFSDRDRTPEATLKIADRNAPGIAEALRYHSMQITPRAMLGRGASAIRKKTLIINLPGSEKAVRESMEFLMGNIEHGLKIMIGSDSECGR